MTVDATKTQFASPYNIDKIQSWNTTEGESGGYGGFGAKVTIPGAANPAIGTTIYTSLPNPYKKKGLMTLSWSLDRTNWYPLNGIILYFNNTDMSWYWQMLVSGGSSDSQIYIFFTTQYTSPQVVYFQWAIGNPS